MGFAHDQNDLNRLKAMNIYIHIYMMRVVPGSPTLDLMVIACVTSMMWFVV